MKTNNNVLNEDKIKIRETITIEVNNSQKKLLLNKDRKTFTDKSIVTTIIEIKEDINHLFFFEKDKNYVIGILYDIFIFQFQE